MAETKLEAHIATLQKTSASGIAEAGSWSKLREELERIVPRRSSDLGSPPALTDNLTEQKLVATAKWISEKELWDKLRAEIETHRLRIRAELDAYRSRKRLAGVEGVPFALGLVLAWVISGDDIIKAAAETMFGMIALLAAVGSLIEGTEEGS